MTRVFIAGPIDFRDLSELVEYRLSFKHQLEDADFTPVDQYSGALEKFSDVTEDGTVLEDILNNLGSLPDEPYVHAVGHAIGETSIEEILSNPDRVPELAPGSVIADIVERDLELLQSCDALLAYFPSPSCGTTVELLHAVDHDIRALVVSDSPPMFVQHYADECYETLQPAVAELEQRFQ
ncbi:hypothetical protein [Haloarcula amylolytica]|uniref:Nucleoside 2-deoxyribosyltransferase n=1 Tax=Haloarcula amylolytica JCM 13557 TaxID=1227452 RepID=M0K454_9EURY|nr:hypothetical protein [Haloarcula amylolytica]EMA15976.1 hypothetical protein C442_18579 [Haloarcula amylolytica JCM 13557]